MSWLISMDVLGISWRSGRGASLGCGRETWSGLQRIAVKIPGCSSAASNLHDRQKRQLSSRRPIGRRRCPPESRRPHWAKREDIGWPTSSANRGIALRTSSQNLYRWPRPISIWIKTRSYKAALHSHYLGVHFMLLEFVFLPSTAVSLRPNTNAGADIHRLERNRVNPRLSGGLSPPVSSHPLSTDCHTRCRTKAPHNQFPLRPRVWGAISSTFLRRIHYRSRQLQSLNCPRRIGRYSKEGGLQMG